jgi:chemotaxis regulatin CheY-phosphate phosphatase CheZ
VSYKDFSDAIKKIAYFDVNLSRMGYLKSQKLEPEVK